jgi:chromosome partitioning protein
MVIECPHCKKKHHVDVKKIPANAKMAKCKACGNRFALRLSGETAAAPIEMPKAKAEVHPPAPKITKELPKVEIDKAEEPGTRKIAVSLSKGGVGKTTTAVNLAVGLALVNKKVLLVDTDTQGQSSYMLGVDPKAGLTELVTEEVEADEALVEAREGLFLLAGGKSLAGLKRLISRKDFGGELVLKEAISRIEDRFDFVIFDTSPGWDVLTVNVLFCADEVIIPVSLEVMTLQGLAEFLKSVAAIQNHREGLRLSYVLPTFFDKRLKRSFTILRKLEDLYGKKLCTPIRTNVRVSEAPAFGKTIYEFAPGSPGADDYRDLIRKVTDDDTLFR